MCFGLLCPQVHGIFNVSTSSFWSSAREHYQASAACSLIPGYQKCSQSESLGRRADGRLMGSPRLTRLIQDSIEQVVIFLMDGGGIKTHLITKT